MRKKLFSSFEEGFSFLEAMAGFCLQSPSEEENVVVETEEGSSSLLSVDEDTDYLSKGRKLLTLAKSLMVKHREYTPISEKLAKIEYCEHPNLEEVLSAMAKVIRREIRGLCDGMVRDSEVVAQLKRMMPNFKWFFGTYDELFVPKVFEAGGPSIELLGKYHDGVPYWCLSKKKRQDPKERTLYLYCPQVFPGYLLCGMQMGTSKYKNAYFSREPYLKPTDLAYAIAYMYMLHTVQDSIGDAVFKDSISYKKTAWCAGVQFLHHQGLTLPYSVLETAYDKQEPCQPYRLTGQTIFLVDQYENVSSTDTLAAYLVKQGNDVFVIHRQERILLPSHELWDILPKFLPRGIIDVINVNSQTNRKYNGADFIEDYKKMTRELPLMNLPVVIEANALFGYLVWKSQFEDFSQQEQSVFMSLAVDRTTWRSEGNVAMPALHSSSSYLSTTGLLLNVFLSAQKVINRDVKVAEEERDDQRDHARSFEDKKNIPKKIVELMESSILNERLGFIEYDEMCDTDAIDVADTQIFSFLDTYFPKVDVSSVTLRFRRLGNHKAAGLYYPTHRCICVEISEPWAFTHEFGHMLDYLYGCVSNVTKNACFKEVYDRYVEVFDKKLSVDSALSDRLRKGGQKSKYNYFTRETEVFARSFELFMSSKLNLDNTILQGIEFYEGKAEYHPEDEKYMHLVDEFFSSLPFMEDVLCNLETNGQSETAA